MPRLAWSFGLVCYALLFFPAVVSAVTRVELKIDEPRSNRSVAWPVTTGVPFPEGQLRDERQCRLLDDRGEEQRLQTKVAATWDAEAKSIRWLTIDFIAEPGRKYTLEFGPEITRKAFERPKGSLADKRVTLNTGALQVTFSSESSGAIESIRIDLNGDGQIAADEVVASSSPLGDHRYVDQQQRVFQNTKVGDQCEIEIDDDGEVRTCLRVDGWYQGPGGEKIVRYRTRYHVFHGLKLLKQVDEFRIVGSTRDTQFADIALPLKLNLATENRTVRWQDAASAELRSHAWQAETQACSLVQETYRHYGNPECRGYVVEQSGNNASPERLLQEFSQAGAWFQVADSRAAVTGSLRWFWQQFPKQWEATRDGLTLHLWSPRAGGLDFGEAGIRKFFGPAGEKYLLNWERPNPSGRSTMTPIENFFFYAGHHALKRDGADGLGINKHHEVWYHFAPAAEAAAGAEYGALADRQPLCLATGEWNCSTGVFGPLAARPNDSPFEAAVDRIFDLEQKAQDDFGDYGWWLYGAGPHYSYQWDPTTQRHFADPRRFEYHTYQRETQLWWCYLRSGERKFYDWAIPSENHWTDIAVAHVPTKFATEWRGGKQQAATLIYPAGDWSIDSPLHYVRHHDTGEAWLRSASQYWGSYHRTLETTTLALFLTGDERYRDIVDFWKETWGGLAGVRSDSQDVGAWYREQLWFKPTKPGEPSKSWAEMIRDYAPFQSGSRHQMTLFFNLATLYEQTWDPQVKQALQEYADAFLDVDHPIGVWRSQDNSLPKFAESPMLAHYWSPALWKYSRATRDPRMQTVLKKYFTTSYEADPYGEQTGVYSNVQIAWGWHFTHDPRHLIAAKYELQRLSKHARPLERPEDLGQRIYNPYAPIETLTAVPRLIAVLDDAKRRGIEVPMDPPLTPQRTVIALNREAGKLLGVTTWGWVERPAFRDAQGKVVTAVQLSATFASHRQPFDRVLPNYAVYRTQLAAPAAGAGWVYSAAELELGVLHTVGVNGVRVWAGLPLRIDEGSAWWWQVGAGDQTLVLESALAKGLRVTLDDQPLTGEIVKNQIRFTLPTSAPGKWLKIDAPQTSNVWFTIPAAGDRAWVAPRPDAVGNPRIAEVHNAPPTVASPTSPGFTRGKFKDAYCVTVDNELHIPDELIDSTGNKTRLSDLKQGTIEFWVRRDWDERTEIVPASVTFLTNGQLLAWNAAKLPLREWAHVAAVWLPAKHDPTRTMAHIYVDGIDSGNYRSVQWAGYAQPPGMSVTREWLKEFVTRAPPGVSFAIDDLRISSVPRYADPQLEFGRDQTLNPVVFTPPTEPAQVDEQTLLYLPLDGDLKAQGRGASVQATVKTKGK